MKSDIKFFFPQCKNKQTNKPNQTTKKKKEERKKQIGICICFVCVCVGGGLSAEQLTLSDNSGNRACIIVPPSRATLMCLFVTSSLSPNNASAQEIAFFNNHHARHTNELTFACACAVMFQLAQQFLVSQVACRRRLCILVCDDALPRHNDGCTTAKKKIFFRKSDRERM